MTTTLYISYREMERLKIITRVEQEDLTVIEGAEALDISERQMYRILHHYRLRGAAGLVHRLRGRASNKAYPNESVAAVSGTILRLWPDTVCGKAGTVS